MTTPAAETGLVHMLYPYTGAGQYLEGTVAYIDQARATGAAVVVAAPAERQEQLRSRLGESDAVTFLQPAAFDRNPGRLLGAWQQCIDEQADGRVVHGINDTTRPIADARYSSEIRYAEWLLNQAFAQSAAWSLLCPIDTGTHQGSDIEALARSHPLMWDGTAHTASADYLTGPYAFDELHDPPSDAQSRSYRREDLGTLRAAIVDFARNNALPASRTRDLALATSELATNSIRHGGGAGTVHLWRENDALACEFRDHGVITDPLAGRRRPQASQLGGRGLWFVNQLCDLVQLRSEPGHGTRIRLWMDLTDPDTAPRTG
jgi:anti-sigma regulatory factor (Ser/Thr protein kinase)